MYMLLAVWAAASTYFLVRCVRQDGTRSVFYAGYVLTAAAGMYTHYAFSIRPGRAQSCCACVVGGSA